MEKAKDVETLEKAKKRAILLEDRPALLGFVIGG